MFMELEGEGDERGRATPSGLVLNRTDSLRESYSISAPQTRYIKATLSLRESSKNNVVLKRLF